MNTLNAYNAKPDGYYMKMRANDPFLGFNSFNDDDDDLFIDRGVIHAKPVELYNLPDDRYLVKNIKHFASGKGWLYSNIYDFFKKFPFRWLSNTISLQDKEDDAILVDPDTVPDFIKEHVYYFYGIDYGTSGFSKYVYLIKNKDIANLSHLTFDDFLQHLKKEGYKFSTIEKDSWSSSGIPVYFFSGIPVKKFFELYFTSGKSHEEIFRFLKDYDNAYDINHDFIKEEVEKILNKH